MGREATRLSDRFAYIADKYEPHRKEHGCYDVDPFANGPLLGALAVAARPNKALEVGCGLGYSGLWLAHGACKRAIVDTIEANKTTPKSRAAISKLKVSTGTFTCSSARPTGFYQRWITATKLCISTSIRPNR